MQRCSIVEAVRPLAAFIRKSTENLVFMRAAARFYRPVSASIIEPEDPSRIR